MCSNIPKPSVNSHDSLHAKAYRSLFPPLVGLVVTRNLLVFWTNVGPSKLTINIPKKHNMYNPNGFGSFSLDMLALQSPSAWTGRLRLQIGGRHCRGGRVFGLRDGAGLVIGWVLVGYLSCLIYLNLLICFWAWFWILSIFFEWFETWSFLV